MSSDLVTYDWLEILNDTQRLLALDEDGNDVNFSVLSFDELLDELMIVSGKAMTSAAILGTIIDPTTSQYFAAESRAEQFEQHRILVADEIRSRFQERHNNE